MGARISVPCVKKNFLFWSFKHNFHLHEKYLIWEVSFTSGSEKGMLEMKDIVAVDSVLPFIAASLDREISCGDEPALTTVHELYSYIANQLLYIYYSQMRNAA